MIRLVIAGDLDCERPSIQTAVMTKRAFDTR